MTSVDVLAATKDGKVKDIIVVSLNDYDLEYAARHALMKMYGTENVFVGVFEIGSVPQDVVRVMVANPIFKRNEWIPYTSLSAPASNARVLVKMKNNYIVIATYYYVGNQSSYWKDDKGQILEQGVVICWKALENDSEPSPSDVSVTQDVLMDIKKPADPSLEEDDTCPDCNGSGEVAGDYFSDDGVVSLWKGLEE